MGKWISLQANKGTRSNTYTGNWWVTFVAEGHKIAHPFHTHMVHCREMQTLAGSESSCWRRGLKQGTESASMEEFRTWLDKSLSNLIWLDLFWAAGWMRWPPHVPSFQHKCLYDIYGLESGLVWVVDFGVVWLSSNWDASALLPMQSVDMPSVFKYGKPTRQICHQFQNWLQQLL